MWFARLGCLLLVAMALGSCRSPCHEEAPGFLLEITFPDSLDVSEVSCLQITVNVDGRAGGVHKREVAGKLDDRRTSIRFANLAAPGAAFTGEVMVNACRSCPVDPGAIECSELVATGRGSFAGEGNACGLFELPLLASVSVSIGAGWAMVAGGAAGSDYGQTEIFAYPDGTVDPEVPATAIKITAAEVEPGRGYWVKNPSPGPITIQMVPEHPTLDLPKGWSLIGNSTIAPAVAPAGKTFFIMEEGRYQSRSVLQPAQGGLVNLGSAAPEFQLQPAP